MQPIIRFIRFSLLKMGVHDGSSLISEIRKVSLLDSLPNHAIHLVVSPCMATELISSRVSAKGFSSKTWENVQRS
jgi:hypothetical protein